MQAEVMDGSRARGALLGAAVGDALGRPLEGHRAPSPAEVDVALASRDLRWTDDTALTIALAESLVASGNLDEDRLAMAFARAWRAEPWRGYGPWTASLLLAVDEGGSWRRLARARPSWGNGAAMRVAPAAILATGDVDRTIDLARRSALVTHTHPLAVDGAVVQALAVAGLDVGQAVRTRAMADQLSRVAALPPDATADDVAFGIGHGVDALSSVPAALAVVKVAGDAFAGAMRFALAVGGDTDTIASMVGAVIGARLGAEGIPDMWLDALEGRDCLMALADALVVR